MRAYHLLEHALVQRLLGFSAQVQFLIIRFAESQRVNIDRPERSTMQKADRTWLLISKQFQCASNSAAQFSRILLILQYNRTTNRCGSSAIEAQVPIYADTVLRRRATYNSRAHLVTLRPSFRQCSGSRFSCLHSIKSSLGVVGSQSRIDGRVQGVGSMRSRAVNILSLIEYRRANDFDVPLYGLQYEPMKNEALLRGAEVTPSSSTWGTLLGSGAGSI